MSWTDPISVRMPECSRRTVTGIATEIWGVLWILIAIGLTLWFLYLSGKTPTDQQTSIEENTKEISDL